MLSRRSSNRRRGKGTYFWDDVKAHRRDWFGPFLGASSASEAQLQVPRTRTKPGELLSYLQEVLSVC